MGSDRKMKDQGLRKRAFRLEPSCDVCRRRKSRCDGIQASGQKCSVCLYADLDCTYAAAIFGRRVSMKQTVEGLETKLAASEALVRQLRTQLADSQSSPSSSVFNQESSSHTTPVQPAPLYVVQTTLRSLSAPTPPSNEEDLYHTEMARDVRLHSFSLTEAIYR
ncbi:hypothetical protein R3P38DRAFT_3138472 [Favolaschia claudopus]|uniref:Zn(2)-C6 fungal-type domain-containing protein n=1 Tax=Favolaschia claudopus TaxID=2862362 RepID=A0AAV9Z5N9_9AGAR